MANWAQASPTPTEQKAILRLFHTESISWTVTDVAIPHLAHRLPGGIFPIDVNGDGRTDLVVSDVNGLPLVVLLNEGSRKFVDGTNKIFPQGTPNVENAFMALVGDFNDDGRSDIFFPTHGLDSQSFGESGAPAV
jgi:hypothetical protein